MKICLPTILKCLTTGIEEKKKIIHVQTYVGHTSVFV